MAEVKWIKIVTDIFDNRKIKLIRKMPEGNAIIVTWLQLLCLAGETNDNGLIYITRAIPYTEESLSNAFDTPLAVVRLALETFQGLEMIDIVDSFLCISNWEKYQNVDGLTRIREQTRKRVAAHREKQRALMSKNVCQYCGGRATGYDHIIPLARGGLDEDFNKVECCMECNRIKNDKPLIDFLNSNRDRINDALIASNSKLSNIVTLHNVTRRYIVTQCNATEEDKDIDIDIDTICSEQNAPEPKGTLPLNDGTEYPIYAEQIERWESLYPNVNVKQELRSMVGWLEANPKKRKTKNGVGRFINGWLAREQDKG